MLGEDWIELAKKLDSSEQTDFNSIKTKYSNDFDRADAFLNQWADKYGDSATTRRLKAALNAIGRCDIAAQIGMCQFYRFREEY